METITIEELDRLLSLNSNISLVNSEKKEGCFNRKRTFRVHDQEFEIEWWCNGSYLNIGKVIIPFKAVTLSNTWPNRSKVNLQFYDSNDYPCCIIPVADWEVEE